MTKNNNSFYQGKPINKDYLKTMINEKSMETYTNSSGKVIEKRLNKLEGKLL